MTYTVWSECCFWANKIYWVLNNKGIMLNEGFLKEILPGNNNQVSMSLSLFHVRLLYQKYFFIFVWDKLLMCLYKLRVYSTSVFLSFPRLYREFCLLLLAISFDITFYFLFSFCVFILSSYINWAAFVP